MSNGYQGRFSRVLLHVCVQGFAGDRGVASDIVCVNCILKYPILCS